MAPNTTQIPNNLFNGEMAKMKDTELRITLLVARKTLGWIEDLETGMRKKEDWIARYQLIKFTGKTGRAISTAIENCIKNNWIEARDKEGKILDTPQKRTGKKIFYRLGRIFLDKVKRGEKSSQVEKSCEKITGENFSGEKSSPYKRNYITKETFLQKNSKATALQTNKKKIDNLINLFKEINPSYQRLFRNKTQRSALERLVKQYGQEKIEWTIKVLSKTNKTKFAPVICTPLQLESKLGQLIAFMQRGKSEKINIEI